MNTEKLQTPANSTIQMAHFMRYRAFRVAPILLALALPLPAEEVFYRGDCNGSGLLETMSVDLADPVAALSFIFGLGKDPYVPHCLDACDANDDGSLDAADAAHLIDFLFRSGAFPPAPGPGFRIQERRIIFTPPGEDPTPDRLDCALGVDLEA